MLTEFRHPLRVTLECQAGACLSHARAGADLDRAPYHPAIGRQHLGPALRCLRLDRSELAKHKQFPRLRSEKLIAAKCEDIVPGAMPLARRCRLLSPLAPVDAAGLAWCVLSLSSASRPAASSALRPLRLPLL